MAKHSSILAWKIPWRERLVGYSPWGCKQSDMTEHAHVQSIHGASLLGCFSCVQLFATLWTEVCQAPLQTRNQCQPRADVGCFHSQVYFPTRHPSSTAADGVQLPRLRKGCSAKHRPTCPALSRLAAGWRGERVALSWGSATCDRTTSPQQTALRPRTTQAYDRPPLCISASRLPISFRSHPALLSGTPSSTP